MRPLFINAIRSASPIASVWSWVTTSVVVPTTRRMSRNSIRSVSRNFASRLDKGSSRSRSLGEIASARAERDALLLPAAQRHRAPLTEPFEAGEAKQLVAPAILLGL